MLSQLRGGPGEGWLQRSLLFDIIRCSGMSRTKALSSKTWTHPVVEDPDKHSEKLHAARTCAGIALCCQLQALKHVPAPGSTGTSRAP